MQQVIVNVSGRRAAGPSSGRRLSEAMVGRRLIDRIKRRLGATPHFGDIGRTVPLSSEFGYDRGTPVDRYYIESFLAAHATDINGHTLEIGDDSYTARFGGARATLRDVLHINALKPKTPTIVDL